MAIRTEVSRGHAATGGLIAGLIGGVVLALLLVVINAAHGQSIWTAFKGAGYPFLGDRALQPGFDFPAVLLGVVCHFAISAIWGLLFGLSAYGLSKGATIASGLAWGVMVWLVMYYIVLPIVGAGDLAHHTPIGLAILNHLIFGLAVGVSFLPFQHPVKRLIERTTTA